MFSPVPLDVVCRLTFVGVRSLSLELPGRGLYVSSPVPLDVVCAFCRLTFVGVRSLSLELQGRGLFGDLDLDLLLFCLGDLLLVLDCPFPLWLVLEWALFLVVGGDLLLLLLLSCLFTLMAGVSFSWIFAFVF